MAELHNLPEGFQNKPGDQGPLFKAETRKVGANNPTVKIVATINKIYFFIISNLSVIVCKFCVSHSSELLQEKNKSLYIKTLWCVL